MVLTIQGQVLWGLTFILLSNLVILHFYSKYGEAFFLWEDFFLWDDFIWLSLGKLHYWFVLHLLKVVKVALLHIAASVNTNAHVESKIKRQKVQWFKMNLQMIHNTCDCVLYIQVAKQIENLKLICFCLELMITDNILIFRYVEKQLKLLGAG